MPAPILTTRISMLCRPDRTRRLMLFKALTLDSRAIPQTQQPELQPAMVEVLVALAHPTAKVAKDLILRHLVLKPQHHQVN